MKIEETLNTLDLNATHRPRYGHCREIAVALHDTFGGQLLAISQVPGYKQLDHVLIRTDGAEYDGCGRVYPASLLHQYVPEPDNPLDDYLFEVSRQEVISHQNFDKDVYNEISYRLDALDTSA